MVEFYVVATGGAVGVAVQPFLQALLVEDMPACNVVHPFSS